MLRCSLARLEPSLGVSGPLRFLASAFSQLSASPDSNLRSSKRVPRSKVEFLAKSLFMPSQSPPDSRLLKVAVVGFPNVGKSSLVNMLTKWRVCAVSGKAHTTRSKQTVIFTKNNIQLAFVDLPGLVSSWQAQRFKLERTFVRDPHSEIFDADLILVIVDASNKYSRESLHPEVLKALHFFPNKESVLVINKVDRCKGDQTRLLDTTRRLTAGVVEGRTSHLDAFAHKFNHRALLSSSEGYRKQRQSVEAIIFPYLPEEAHEAARQRLASINRLRALLPPPIQIDAPKRLPLPPLSPPPPRLQEQQPKLECLDPIVPSASDDRCVTEIEHQSIEEFFADFKPSPKSASVTGLEGTTIEIGEDDPYLESILDRVKERLMLKSATKEEVAVRREQWRQLAIELQGVTHWEGFSRVFMVSAASGEGIDSLRNYLLERAELNPRQWLLSAALITDQEPSELIRMCVWARCLDQLPKEIPYSIVIAVDECEQVRLANEGDDRIYVHARLRCPNERTLKNVIGPRGTTIRSIASAVKQELSDMFQAPTVVKLSAEALRPSRNSLQRLRKAKDFAEVFPNFGHDARPKLESIDSIKI